MPNKIIASSKEKNSRNRGNLLKGQCIFSFIDFWLARITRIRKLMSLENEEEKWVASRKQ